MPTLTSQPSTADVARAWDMLDSLTDPEIPVVTLRELGILRDVRAGDAGLEVVITPTYSGCPAMGAIEDDVKALLQANGLQGRVVTQLAPAWTTDWMTDAPKTSCVPTALPRRTPAPATYQAQPAWCSLLLAAPNPRW